MTEVGSIIRSRRKEFGLTQTQLSTLSKVGINTITQIEHGEGNPTIRSLERVLDTLGLRLTARVNEP